MKLYKIKKAFFLILLTVILNSNAQILTPQSSPFNKTEQKIGLTDVVLEYSRPSMKGRTVFGNLVPYGKLWRSGANKNTMITFTNDVIIDNKELKAGSYAIFINPSMDNWEVFFYTDTNNWGTPKVWDDAKVALKIKVKTQTFPIQFDTWSITFNDITNTSANIVFIWENTYTEIPFQVPTDAIVDASIASTMSGPSANDYYAAAVYYLNQEKDLNKANEWMNTAMTMTKEPAFWQYRQQSLLYAKIGDKKRAIITAKKSLEGAKKAENADYIKMNLDSLKEWGAL